METITLKRRRLRLTLRVAMLLVLVAGVWMASVVNKARRQRDAVAAARRLGGSVHFDWEFVNGHVTKGTQPHGPRWLRRLLGNEFFQELTSVNLVYDDSTGQLVRVKNLEPADDMLARLEGQTGLKFLLMEKGQATDEGLKHIKDLTNLEVLVLRDARRITDKGVAHLQNLRNLKFLILAHSKLTDRGMGFLKGCTKLETLRIEGTQVSDGGLAALEGMKQLSMLSVGQTQVSDAGTEHLKGLGKLSTVLLNDTRVSNRGLENLKALPSLRLLRVHRTQVDGEGVERFRKDAPAVDLIDP